MTSRPGCASTRSVAISRGRAGSCSLFVALAMCISFALTSCSTVRSSPSAPTAARPSATSAGATLCRAVGAFAEASHYGEHVRRPDPIEEPGLARAQAIAQSALAGDPHGDSRTRRLATRLIAAIGTYWQAFRDGIGINTALLRIRAVVAEFPASCLADRFVPLG
jgi:hypothetical protein